MRFSIWLLVPVSAFAQPSFTPVSTDITHQYVGGWEHFVGGGVAIFDCDGDMLPELYVAGGETASVLLHNRSELHGAVEFVVDTPAPLQLTAVTGAYPLDIDGDGLLDLFVTRVGANQILKGLGDCTFGNVTNQLGFAPRPAWTTAFSATWEADQSSPTLAIGNYVDRDDPDGPFEACDDSWLYRSQSYQNPIALRPSFCTLSMLFTDWGRKGRQDLRVSNDRHYYVRGGSEQMWAMEDLPRLYGDADGWQDFSIWGMGIASEDMDGDGMPEVFLSSMGDQKMQTLNPDSTGPNYLDATYDSGTTAHRPYIGDDGRPSTGWHIAFGDIDNDGLPDAFIAKGNVDQMPGAAMKDPNNLLIQTTAGDFEEMGNIAGTATMERSRGAGLADFNLDGRLDLVVVNRRAAIEIYENTTADAGNWILLDIRQADQNVYAVGAWIEIQTENRNYHREITVGGGHVSGSLTFQHFGLGQSTELRLRVVWPDGQVSAWNTLKANQHYAILRDSDDLAIDVINLSANR